MNFQRERDAFVSFIIHYCRKILLENDELKMSLEWHKQELRKNQCCDEKQELSYKCKLCKNPICMECLIQVHSNFYCKKCYKELVI